MKFTKMLFILLVLMVSLGSVATLAAKPAPQNSYAALWQSYTPTEKIEWVSSYVKGYVLGSKYRSKDFPIKKYPETAIRDVRAIYTVEKYRYIDLQVIMILSFYHAKHDYSLYTYREVLDSFEANLTEEERSFDFAAYWNSKSAQKQKELLQACFIGYNIGENSNPNRELAYLTYVDPYLKKMVADTDKMYEIEKYQGLRLEFIMFGVLKATEFDQPISKVISYLDMVLEHTASEK